MPNLSDRQLPRPGSENPRVANVRIILSPQAPQHEAGPTTSKSIASVRVTVMNTMATARYDLVQFLTALSSLLSLTVLNKYDLCTIINELNILVTQHSDWQDTQACCGSRAAGVSATRLGL